MHEDYLKYTKQKQGNVAFVLHYTPPVAIYQLIDIHTTMTEKDIVYHAYLEGLYLLQNTGICL